MKMTQAVVILAMVLLMTTPALAGKTVYEMSREGMTTYQVEKGFGGQTTVTEIGPRGTRVTIGQKNLLGGPGDTTIIAPNQRRANPTATDLIMQEEGEGEE